MLFLKKPCKLLCSNFSFCKLLNVNSMGACKTAPTKKNDPYADYKLVASKSTKYKYLNI